MSSTQFVQIYHPLIGSTITTPVWVALQSVDDHVAHGWLLVDPEATLPDPVTPYYTKEALLSQISAGAAPIGTALRAAFGRQAAAYGDPSGQPDGAVTALTSGQAVQSFGSAPIVVSGGRYVHTPFAAPNSAGYLQADLGKRVGRVWADPIWLAGATGAIALVLPSGRWDQGTFVPAGIHFVMYHDSWHVGYWTGSAESPEYEHGEFATALDDGQPHRVEIVLDGDTAYLNFPDGTTYPVQHANIDSAVSARVIWELYEGDGTADAPAQFAGFGADVVPDAAVAAATPLSVARTQARIPSPALPTVEAAPETVAVSSGESEVMRTSFTVPSNYKQWVQLTAYLEVTSQIQVFFQVRVTTQGGGGGQLQWEQLIVDSAAAKGTYSFGREIDLTGSGFSAGDRVDVVWNVWGTAASGAQIVSDANKAKTMHLSPVAA